MVRDNSGGFIEKTDNSSQPERKISLFRSYFRGREEVFPRRFESQKTGKSGYQPVCKNEWSPGLCLKPTIKCGTCKNREEPVRASLARKLGTFLLSETMESYPGLGLDSYDRLFPCQDTLPKGGFGNLIALPLQKKPREQGNSVFINSAFEPYPDQWAFLASIQKMSLDEVEFIVLEAQRKNQILGISAVEEDDDELEPWKLLPSKIKNPAPITGGFARINRYSRRKPALCRKRKNVADIKK